ncbi:hypothetical protein GCM10027416_01510 [Okibacterium endophyticum]
MSLPPELTPNGDVPTGEQPPVQHASRREAREYARRRAQAPAARAAYTEDTKAGDPKEDPKQPQAEDPRQPGKKPHPRVTVLGVVGELLLTTGVLVLLFLFWQLWLNDLVVRNEQNQAAADLAEGWTPPEIESPPKDSEPVDFGEPVIMEQPADAEAFGVMYIPRFGEDYQQTIAGGTSASRVLNTIGMGHYNDTQMPGQAGNFALAGHRNTHGAPLKQVAELQVGDAIVIKTPEGWYTYRFRTLEYVKPTSVEVLNPVPQADVVETTDALITLTSCNPMFSTAERIIAYGVFESWQPLSAGEPPALTELES